MTLENLKWDKYVHIFQLLHLYYDPDNPGVFNDLSNKFKCSCYSYEEPVMKKRLYKIEIIDPNFDYENFKMFEILQALKGAE